MTQLSRTTYFTYEADMEENLCTWAAALPSKYSCAGEILECLFGKALSLYMALGGYEQAMEVVGTEQQSVMFLLQQNCQAQLWHTDPDLGEFTRSLIGMFEPVPRVKNMYVYAKDKIAVPTEVKMVRPDEHETPWDALETYKLATKLGPYTEVYFSNWNAHRGPAVHLPEGSMRAILLHTTDLGQADTPQGQQFWELSAIDTLLIALEKDDPCYPVYSGDLVLQYVQNREGEPWVKSAVDKFLDMMRRQGAYSRTPFWHRMRRSNELSDAIANKVVIALPRAHTLPCSLSLPLLHSLLLSGDHSRPPSLLCSLHTPTYLHPAGSPLSLL